MKRVFCTYFDHRYLPRGLALISSLRAQGSNDEVWVLCLSDECRRVLEKLALPGIRLLSFVDLEAAYPDLLRVKSERSTVEYYFTCSPQIMRHLFDRVPDAEMVVYLDADLYFFDRMDLLFDEVGDAPVAITPHKYPPRLKYLEKFGFYNVSCVVFRRNDEGLACVNWWAERCIEWCHDVAQPDGRFADQGYLNRFPEVSRNLKILNHPGINLAPWNVENYRITKEGERVKVSGLPLIYFHCHGVARKFGCFYFNLHRAYGAPFGRVVRNAIYRRYIAELARWESEVAKLLRNEPAPQALLSRGRHGKNAVKLKDIIRDVWRFILRLVDIVSGRAILVIGKSVY